MHWESRLYWLGFELLVDIAHYMIARSLQSAVQCASPGRIMRFLSDRKVQTGYGTHTTS
jgi:hypothetical protein